MHPHDLPRASAKNGQWRGGESSGELLLHHPAEGQHRGKAARWETAVFARWQPPVTRRALWLRAQLPADRSRRSRDCLLCLPTCPAFLK